MNPTAADRPTGPTPALACRDVVVEIGGATILGPLTITVAAGEAVAITGTHGAGKTTLLAAVAGMLPISAGSVEVAGGAPTADTVSWMSPTPRFAEGRSLAELVDEAVADRSGGVTPEHAEDLLVALGLGERRHDPPSILSRGMRQRAALLVEIVRSTPLLCLDEPLAGVEFRARDTVIDVLLDACAGGRAALVATHDPDVVARLHREILLEAGRVAADTVWHGPADGGGTGDPR